MMLGWLLLTTAIYFLLPTLFKNSLEQVGIFRRIHPLFLVAGVALIVRLIPMVLLPVGAGYDIESFRLVGAALLNKEDVYTSAAFGRHPYLPMQMYWIGFALYLNSLTAVPFVILIKLLPVLVDVLIAVLIYQAGRYWQKSQAEALLWGLLYALNPIAILVSAYHGQFDSIPVFFLMLSWMWWEFHKRTKLSAGALGLAILNKTWPIVFLPIMLVRNLKWKYWLVFTIVSLAIPVVATLAYVLVLDTDPMPMLRRALTHTGPDGYWGMSALLALLKNHWSVFEPIYTSFVAWRRWIILFTGIIVLWWTRRQTVVAALTTIILAVFMVSSGMGIQWLLWIVPFAILDADHRWLSWYSLTGMLFLLVQLYGLHMYPWLYELFLPETADSLVRLGSLPAWFTVTLWTIARLRRNQYAAVADPI